MVAASTGSGRLERTGSPPFRNHREHSLNAGLASRRRGRPSYQRVVKPLLVLRYFARRRATILTTHPRSPLRLHTLGGLSIGDGHSPTHRSRRALALMSIAASAGADGVERDRILALLWPESDTRRANNSFRQILFGIRRDLGAGGIVYEAARFRLNPALFEVDLWDFEYAGRIGNL